MNAEGALLGPWGIFIQMPKVGQAHENLLDAVTSLGHLPEAVKQVALIVVGAHFKAAYEIYAHVAIVTKEGMSSEKATTLAAGSRPSDLTPEEACGYDVAFALLQGGVLPGAVYAAALKVLGQDGLNGLVQWICAYATVSIMLNEYDVPSEQTFEPQ